jgi:FkbM family methyltransferase
MTARTQVGSAMSFEQRLLRPIQRRLLGLQHKRRYREHLVGPDAEREMRIVHLFIDRQRSALDVGVHLGMYTRHFARFARSVIGFEANPESANLARQALQGIATIEWVALSSESGYGTLRVPLLGVDGTEPALGTLSEANKLQGRSHREVQVPIRRMDDFELPPVGFVKIDVEGHEEAVLKGGERLLERDRPSYMIEVEERHNPGSVMRVIQFFEQRKYIALFFDGTLLKGVHQMTRLNWMPSSDTYLNNFFFVPA